MPKVDDFSLTSILAYASSEVKAFNEGVRNTSTLYRDDLSEELADIIIKQNVITKRVAEVDQMAEQALGVTQARITRVQNDIYELKGGWLIF